MRQFQFELLEVFFVLLAGLMGIVANRLGISIEIYLPVILGFLIASSVLLLKREVLKRIDSRLKLYEILWNIEDEELREIGARAIQKCKIQLENIAKGHIELDGDEFYQYIITKMKSAKSHVSAIHIATDKHGMLLWTKDSGIRKYYTENKRAINARKVKIERLFILKRNIVINSKTKRLDNSIISILQEQIQDGIEVEIKLINSLDDISIENEFMIYDHEEVQTNYPKTNEKSSKLFISRNKTIVKDYQTAFDKLKASCEPLSEFLKTNQK